MGKLQALVIDDEWNMRNLLRIYLTQNGLSVKEAASGEEGLRLLNQESFDIILLDLMMPDMDGWQVCARIRQNWNTPILMLTARTDTKDKVQGLSMGADDYVTKPFEPDEFIARVFALIRRSSLQQTQEADVRRLRFAGMEIYPEGRQVIICHKNVDFTQKEFDLLVMLAENAQRTFSREAIVERVWGYDYLGDTRVVDKHVKNMREKTERAGLPYNPILTVWGVGYKLFLPDNNP